MFSHKINNTEYIVVQLYTWVVLASFIVRPIMPVSTKFQNTRRARAAVNRQGYFSYSYTIWYGKRVVLIAIIRRKFSLSKLKSPSRLSTNYRNNAFWLLEAGIRVADVPCSFGCNEQTIYRLQTRFRQPGSKNYKPPPGTPRITTLLEVRVIVTSTWRNRLMAAWKLLKHLRPAISTRNSVFTARNRLGALDWFLSFDMTPLCKFDEENGYIFRIFCWKCSH